MSSNVEVVPRVPRDRMEATEGRACRSATAVPPLRFKGFDGAWNENTIGGCFDLSVSNNTLSRACLADFGSVRNVHYGDVLIRLSDVTDVKNSFLPFVADERFKVTSKNGLRNGDIVMADTAEDEAVGKVTEIRGVGNFTVVSGLHTIALRPNVPFGDGFLGVYMNSSAFHDGLRQIMQGVKVLSVSKGALVDVGMRYPLETEQRKIGTSFRQIDALIAARAKALGKLTNLKKAMLEKMFPRADSKVPEVRFKGFEGDWDEKRLGDAFGMSVSTNTLSRSCLSDHGTVKNVHYGDVLIKLPCVTDAQTSGLPFVTDEKFRTSAKNLLRDGDVVMADTAEDSTAGKVTEVRGIGNQQVVSGLHTIVLRPNESFGEGFLGYCLNSESFHSGLQSIMQGVKVLSVNKSALVDCTLFVPSFSEQRRIGAYFRSLDSLIAARREEIGKLKDLKKALLDRMFV